MKTIVEPDKHNRIILTRKICQAAGVSHGEPLELSATPGRIVLKVNAESGGKIIKKGRLKIWTGRVPALPLEEAVEKVRRYSR